jgi:2-keto-3-deoxy-L-rhamnonate aldolase RhmA
MTRLGTVLTLPDVVLAEAIGTAFDLVWIDLEHGAVAPRDVPALAIALRAAGCEAHVRLASARGDDLAPVADAGVDGIVVPGAETAAELESVLARLDYPPRGRRGYGPRRAGGYGRLAGLPPRPDCTVQIETPGAVAAAAEIARAPGVDALVVGTSDLAMALTGDVALDGAALREAVAAVERAARAAGIAFGVAGGGDPARLAGLCATPPALLVHSVDVRLVAAAADAAAAALRGAACR